MKYKFAITVGELCAARLFASSDLSRLVLNGVRVEVRSGGVVLVACDGRSLAVLRSEQLAEEGTYALIIPSDTIDRVKTKTKKTSVLFADYDDEAGTISFSMPGVFTLRSEVIDGTYPNWRMTLPTVSGSDSAGAAIPDLCVNPELFQRLLKAGKLLGRTDGVSVRFTGPNGAIEVKLCNVPQFYGLIMPMRNVDPAIPHPGWLNDDWNPSRKPRPTPGWPSNAAKSKCSGWINDANN